MSDVALNSIEGAASTKPQLDLGVRLRLSGMMFLQFAVWGSWFTVFGVYCGTDPASGGLGFDKFQIGSLYGTMAIGAIVASLIAGQLADRVLASEYLMAIFHLLGAVLLYTMAHVHSYEAMWWTALGYALVYNPTLTISTSLSFSNIPDGARDFPSLRVLGTIGWIAAGLALDYVLPDGSASTNRPLLMAAGVSAVLGAFSFALPHTPTSNAKGDALPFLRAVGLLKNRSFATFFAVSFVITIALAFYFNFAGNFLEAIGVKKVAATMTIGQGSEIFFMLLLPFALKRFGMKWVLAIGMGAWAVRYGLFSLGHPWLAILFGIAIHGVCFDFFLAAGFIYIDSKAPAAIRSSAQALFSFLIYGVGMWIGNMVGGIVGNHYTTSITGADGKVTAISDWSSIWAVPAVGALVCLIVFLFIWKDQPGKLTESDASTERSEFPVTFPPAAASTDRTT